MLIQAGWANDVQYLSVNYRSGPQIIALASQIAQNPELYTDYERNPQAAMRAAQGAADAHVAWTVLARGEERPMTYLPPIIRASLQKPFQTRALLVRNNWMKRDLESVLESMPGSRDKFEISTIHSAKGKEWDHVILTGLARGKFPSRANFWQTLSENVRSESRVLYVAVTRAKHCLEVFEADGGAFYPAIYNRRLDL